MSEAEFMATKKTGKDALLWWCQEVTKGYESMIFISKVLETHCCQTFTSKTFTLLGAMDWRSVPSSTNFILIKFLGQVFERYKDIVMINRISTELAGSLHRTHLPKIMN